MLKFVDVDPEIPQDVKFFVPSLEVSSLPSFAAGLLPFRLEDKIQHIPFSFPIFYCEDICVCITICFGLFLVCGISARFKETEIILNINTGG